MVSGDSIQGPLHHDRCGLGNHFDELLCRTLHVCALEQVDASADFIALSDDGDCSEVVALDDSRFRQYGGVFGMTDKVEQKADVVDFHASLCSCSRCDQ